MKKSAFIAFKIILVLALVGWLQATPTAAHPTATFNVDTLTDAHDANLGDGVCNNGVDGCSLRAAIEQAAPIATNLNPVNIYFWSGISGGTINLAQAYGQINWTGSYILVNGQDSYITVSGSNLVAGQSVFRISGSHNYLSYLTIRNAPQDGVQVGDFGETGEGHSNLISYNTILGNGFMGVYVHGSDSGGGGDNSITDNRIGISLLGATGCVAGEGNALDGVYIDWNAYNTTLYANVIGCNARNGVNIYAGYDPPNHTQITYNYIGYNLTQAVPNQGAGILDQGGQYTSITRSVISGNAQEGVWLSGAQYASIENNKIGTEYIGTAAVPNGWDGIQLSDGATNNTIGGSTSADQRNVISGNGYCGVRIAGSTNNTVDNNLIGLNAAGTAAIGNAHAGICMFNAGGNYIGSNVLSFTQYISGNGREGIYLSGSDSNTIRPSNYIGVATDNATPLGNGLQGVMIVDSEDNFLNPGVVAFNQGAGIAVVGNLSTDNLILPVVVRDNYGLPIDLGNDGFTANDPGDMDVGPNNLLNYPVITSFSGSPVTIQGTACANCEIWVYGAYLNPTAALGGGSLLGYASSADGAGQWSYTLPASANFTDVSLVARDHHSSINNTSEMSPRLQAVYLPLVRK